jgi:hypothetical protein
MNNLACPVKGCANARRNTSMLMCWPCWRRCPRILQRAVWDAFGCWQRHHTHHTVVEMRAAQRTAILAVEAKRAELAG